MNKENLLKLLFKQNIKYQVHDHEALHTVKDSISF